MYGTATTMTNLMDIQDGGLILKQPMLLLDFAAIAATKYYSSSELTDGKHHLDEALLRKVAYWSFPQDIRQVRAFASMTDSPVNWINGMRLVEEKKIKEMWQVDCNDEAVLVVVCEGFVATAYFTNLSSFNSQLDNETRVTLMVERQKIIRSSCSQCNTRIWCQHITAAVIYRIENPDKVILHAPISEICLSLDRDQLQKLVQYTVNDDPVMLGKVFKHFNEIRYTKSEGNDMNRLPDLTRDGLQAGDKSHWDVLKDQLSSNISCDLKSMIKARSDYNRFSTSYYNMNSNYYQYQCSAYLTECSSFYPEGYDITRKRFSKFFRNITPVLEFVSHGEYISAAELMQRIICFTAREMAQRTRADYPNLSRLWSDLSHIHALLVLRTTDIVARNILLNTANKINVTPIMREYIPLISDWTDLPSLCQLFPADDAEKLKTEGHMLVESMFASKLQSYPDDLCKLLDGTDSIDNTSYDEDLIIMLARLESVFYFEEDRHQKIIRLGFLILHKLTIQARKYSVIGSLTDFRTSKSDYGDPSNSIKLVTSGPLATFVKAESECATSSSSSVQPMEEYSVPASDRRQKMKRGSSKDKHPAKRFKSEAQRDEEQKTSQGFVWSNRQIAYAMLYTLHLMIESQEVAGLDVSYHKQLIGYCLQALELSRHHEQPTVDSSNEVFNALDDEASESEELVISKLEQDWCDTLDEIVCDYLGLVEADESHDAVALFIDNLYIVDKSGSFNSKKTSGVYPLLFKTMLCQLINKNSELKNSKSKQLLKMCSDTLLNSTNCPVYNLLLKEAGPVKSSTKDKLLTDAVNKYYLIIEMFLSLVDTDIPEHAQLLALVLKQLKRICNATLLKLIGKDLRLHVWRYKDDPRVAKTMIKFTIHEILVVAESPLSFAATRQTKSQHFKLRYFDMIEKEFVLFLLKKLDMSALQMLFEVWQRIFTCKELQDLVLSLDRKFNNGNHSNGIEANLAPEVVTIMDEFYSAESPHDEQACTMLERFLKPGSAAYKRIKNKIIANMNNYNTGALFHLVRLQLSISSHAEQSCSSDTPPICIAEASNQKAPVTKYGDTVTVAAPMNQETFNILEKAFEKLGCSKATWSILEAVEWVCSSVVRCEANGEGKDITCLPFYDKLISCICHHSSFQPQIVLKILQRIESSCGDISCSYLAGHKSISELGSALITAYRNYFVNRLKENKLVATKKITEEIERARVDCKKFMPDGDTKFDTGVVEQIEKSYKVQLKQVKKMQNAHTFSFGCFVKTKYHFL